MKNVKAETRSVGPRSGMSCEEKSTFAAECNVHTWRVVRLAPTYCVGILGIFHHPDGQWAATDREALKSKSKNLSASLTCLPVCIWDKCVCARILVNAERARKHRTSLQSESRRGRFRPTTLSFFTCGEVRARRSMDHNRRRLI